MKITLCGSMRFAREMMEAKKELEEMGHEVEVPCDTQHFIDNPGFTTDNHADNYNHCIDNDIIRRCFNQLAESDAILVLNLPKNGIEGYVGASALMEIGLAYYLKKKIFILNPLPELERLRHVHGIMIMQPTVLGGDLKMIGGSG